MFKGNNLTQAGGWGGSISLDGKNADEWKIAMAGQYSEYVFALPETIDMTQCQSFAFYLSEQSAPACFKLYKADSNAQNGRTQVGVIYGQGAAGDTNKAYVFENATNQYIQDFLFLHLYIDF